MVCTHGYAQSRRADSLQALLKEPYDSTYIQRLNALSWELTLLSKTAEAEAKTRMADSLARAIRYTAGEARAICQLGIIEQIKGNYPAALKLYFRSLELNRRIMNRKEMAFNYQCIGAIFSEQQNYTEAIRYFHTAQPMYEELHDTVGLSYILGNLGQLAYQNQQYQEALTHIGACLHLKRKLGNRNGIAIALTDMAYTFYQLKQYDSALAYFNEARSFTDSGRVTILARNHLGLGKVWLKKKDYLKAEKEFLFALDTYQSAQMVKELADVYESLAQLDSSRGRWESAYRYHQWYLTYHDSSIAIRDNRKLVEAQMQFRFDQKEAVEKAVQEKKDLLARSEMKRQETIRNISLIGLVLVMIFLVVAMRQRNRLRIEKRKVEIEKERSDNLLLNILPAEVAEELKETGSAVARHYNSVSVLFTDFVNFTGVGEKLAPQALVSELHTCFMNFDRIIEKHGLEKIKTIGDAYLAVGGLPLRDVAHAENVLKASLEIRQYMEERQAALQEKTFRIRIGIHTGSVVAGIVGVKKFAYDIWGDTVNTAARMEQNSEAGRINVSETTYEITKEQFHFSFRGDLDVKNKGKMKMYFLETS